MRLVSPRSRPPFHGRPNSLIARPKPLVRRASVRSEQICRPFSDDDGGGVGVAADDRRHDRRVRDPQMCLHRPGAASPRHDARALDPRDRAIHNRTSTVVRQLPAAGLRRSDGRPDPALQLRRRRRSRLPREAPEEKHVRTRLIRPAAGTHSRKTMSQDRAQTGPTALPDLRIGGPRTLSTSADAASRSSSPNRQMDSSQGCPKLPKRKSSERKMK